MADTAVPKESLQSLQFESNYDVDNDDMESTCSTGDESGMHMIDGNKRTNRIGNRETKLVNGSKWLVYLVILLSAAAASTATYFFMEEEEVRWYTDQFEDYAEEVFGSTQLDLEIAEEVLFALSEAWKGYSISRTADNSITSSGFNVTFPNFGGLADHLAMLASLEMIAVAPMVASSERGQFEAYALENQGWIARELASENLPGNRRNLQPADFSSFLPDPGPIPNQIYGFTDDADFHLPVWQIYPTPKIAAESAIMMDLLGKDWFATIWEEVLATKASVLAPVENLDFLLDYLTMQESSTGKEDHDGHSTYAGPQNRLLQATSSAAPKSLLVEPVTSIFGDAFAVMVGVISWDTFFEEIIEEDANGLILDLDCRCNHEGKDERYSFQVSGDEILYLGHNLVHSSKYESMTKYYNLTGAAQRITSQGDSCGYMISVHVTDEFVEHWQNNDGVVFPIIVGSIFMFTGLVFLVYDFFVQRRNKKVLSTAVRSTAIVESLFPKNVADQMMQEQEEETITARAATVEALEAFNAGAPGGVTSKLASSKKPIADLFSETTIMFADIAGFTAWSSMREPCQVFQLLETIFNSFDEIADRRKVFKVETVGDCYVAVCGLPVPRRDHAIVMARFSWECMLEMRKLTKVLEVELGPDTSNLDLRFGLHSGPVTAGVLRGQRARFQLFGDSMNKASRIETSGKKGRVHLSKETADILITSGKDHWVVKRGDMVDLKGLGRQPTFWLNLKVQSTTSTSETHSSQLSLLSGEISKKQFVEDEVTMNYAEQSEWRQKMQLAVWHTNVMSTYLQKIVAFRAALESEVDESAIVQAENNALFGKATPTSQLDFPIINHDDVIVVDLDEEVCFQLKEFTDQIAAAYNPNAFHSFHHASHVVMSITKLFAHMEASSKINLDCPMTQFAVVLAGLIHDVDHPGVPNDQLVAEGHALATKYQSSIAERNSLDVFWKILSQDCFHALRRTIYRTPEEFERFHELIVHSVLVTDIMDKDIQNERKKRWADSFGNNLDHSDASRDQEMVNKQKTALLEHLIQTSDVAHTMQHWNVYKRWNNALYRELSLAFQNGRASTDPCEFWYEGEMKFFDFCIIPLAKRMKECQAFQVYGEEMLQYALSNRKEWEAKGESI